MAGPLPARLCGWEQLAVLRDYPAMITGLCGRGLEPEEAAAVAYNAALLYHALDVKPPLAGPEEVLGRFSLGEIAALCALQERAQCGEAEYGSCGEGSV